jgi:phosphoadenosine phosphosulfate reductase
MTRRSFTPAPPVIEPGQAIALHARAVPGHEARVEQTLDTLRQAAAAHPASIVLATSLGAEDQVLTDLIARHRLPIAIATLLTGQLHDETLELLTRTEIRYGLRVEIFAPAAEAVMQFVGRHGADAMYQSIELRQACCRLRKLEPLSRLIAGREAWVTGLRREQSAHRSAVALREAEPGGRVKWSPLADWSQADVWHYIARHDVPYNPLHDAFMPSIGCAPCTRAIALGEDLRAGRWWWEDEGRKECGLHVAEVRQTASAATPLPTPAPTI